MWEFHVWFHVACHANFDENEIQNRKSKTINEIVQ
jgi:hypothetical protein